MFSCDAPCYCIGRTNQRSVPSVALAQFPDLRSCARKAHQNKHPKGARLATTDGVPPAAVSYVIASVALVVSSREKQKKRPLAALQTFPCGSYSPDNWSLSLTPGRLSPAVWFRGELSPPCPTSNPASDRGSNTTKYPSHGAAALVLWLDQCVSPVGSSHLVNLRFFHGPVGATVLGCFRSVVLILPPLVVGLPDNINPVPFPGERRWTAAAHLPRASGIRERFACRRRGSGGEGSGAGNRCRGFR